MSSEDTLGRQHIAAAHSDQAGWDAHLRDAFGTASDDFAGQTLLQICGVMQPDQSKHIPADQINTALAIVHGIAPRDEAEGMLAAQMAGTHTVAMAMLRRAHSAQSVDGMREYGNLATKLLHTFTAQMEALGKVRRGGEQTVRVEHVYVHEGGQAIVGNVSHRGDRMETTDKAMRLRALRLSNMRQAPRCGARTRSGKPCVAPAVKGKRRCRMHGGAKGIGALEGPANGMYRRGQYTLAHQEEMSHFRAILAAAAKALDAL